MRSLALCILSATALAAALDVQPAVAQQQPADVEQMREQLEQMRREGAALRRAVQVLEQRVRELEAGGAPPTAPQVQPAPRPESPMVAQPAAPPPEAAPSAETEEATKEAPPSRAVEAVVSEEHVLFSGGAFVFEPALTYARFDRTQLQLSGFLALDAIFLGSISVDELESDILTLDLTGRYNVNDRLQFRVTTPWMYRSTTFQSGGAGAAANVVAEENVDSGPDVGDISFGASYRLLREGPVWPDVVLNADVRAPTGIDPFGIEVREVPGTEGNLTVPEELPTGNGVWQVSSGLSFLKTVDPAVLFANFTYFHNFAEEFDDISGDPGAQPGEVELGDSFEYGLGVAFALNEVLSLSLSYSQRFIGDTNVRVEGGEFAEVIGSDANVAALNFGLTYGLSENLSLVTNVAAGLTEDAADVQFTVRLPYRF